MTAASVTRQDVVDFVYQEARLLDTRQFDTWNALFLDGGMYWIPATPNQPDPWSWTSHAYEDKLLRDLRIERLNSPRTFNQHPPSRCHHLLQTPVIEVFQPDEARYIARTEFLYTESQADHVTSLVGSCTHELAHDGERLRIKLKKIELLNCDGALPSIQLFI